MKFWPVLGTVLSLVTGSLPDSLSANIDSDARSGSAARESSGWGIEGDGFYVWDEDRREAEDWAIELVGPAFPPRDAR